MRPTTVSKQPDRNCVQGEINKTREPSYCEINETLSPLNKQKIGQQLLHRNELLISYSEWACEKIVKKVSV